MKFSGLGGGPEVVPVPGAVPVPVPVPGAGTGRFIPPIHFGIGRGKNFNSRSDASRARAVMDVLVDGERIEGVGVTPDVEVEFSIPYANGADPPLEKAIDVLLDDIRMAR